jgi:hypothetical protein
MEAKGKLDWRKPLDSKEMKQFKAELAAMTPEQRAMMMKNKFISNPKKLAVAQVGVEKKDKFAKDTEYAKQTHNIFQAYGMTQEATEIERRNPMIVEDITDRTKRTKEGMDRGYHKDWDKEIFNGADGEILIETMTKNAKDFHEFAKTFSELSAEAQAAWQKSTQAMLPSSTEETRRAYAITTGKPDEAYAASPAHLGTYVSALRPNELENVDTSSMSTIAKHVSSSAAAGAIGMSDDKKKELIKEWKRLSILGASPTGTPADYTRGLEAQAKLDDLEKLPGWKSLIV